MEYGVKGMWVRRGPGHLRSASWAPGTAQSSTWSVPLRSISTAFNARLLAMAALSYSQNLNIKS